MAFVVSYNNLYLGNTNYSTELLCGVAHTDLVYRSNSLYVK